MNPEFWHDKWQKNDIGFHLAEANPLLVKYFNALQLQPGQRIFIPLCGKSLDIAWLLNQGLEVVGIELNEMAVSQLFEQLKLEPTIETLGSLKLYHAKNLRVFVGDIFTLTFKNLGKVSAVYDRAALVALPETMRSQYSQHVIAISQNARQLLICFDYCQQEMPGPPFAISDAEVRRHYSQNYQLQKLASMSVEDGLKGQVSASENVWLLGP